MRRAVNFGQRELLMGRMALVQDMNGVGEANAPKAIRDELLIDFLYLCQASVSRGIRGERQRSDTPRFDGQKQTEETGAETAIQTMTFIHNLEKLIQNRHCAHRTRRTLGFQRWSFVGKISTLGVTFYVSRF